MDPHHPRHPPPTMNQRTQAIPLTLFSRLTLKSFMTEHFNVKAMSMFDHHVDLTLKLHLISNNFQISNFRFSLEEIARGDIYHKSKWKVEPVLHQAANLEVMLIRHRNEIEKTHRYFIDFQSQIYVKLFMPNGFGFHNRRSIDGFST